MPPPHKTMISTSETDPRFSIAPLQDGQTAVYFPPRCCTRIGLVVVYTCKASRASAVLRDSYTCPSVAVSCYQQITPAQKQADRARFLTSSRSPSSSSAATAAAVGFPTRAAASTGEVGSLPFCSTGCSRSDTASSLLHAADSVIETRRPPARYSKDGGGGGRRRKQRDEIRTRRGESTVQPQQRARKVAEICEKK